MYHLDTNKFAFGTNTHSLGSKVFCSQSQQLWIRNSRCRCFGPVQGVANRCGVTLWVWLQSEGMYDKSQITFTLRCKWFERYVEVRYGLCRLVFSAEVVSRVVVHKRLRRIKWKGYYWWLRSSLSTWHTWWCKTATTIEAIKRIQKAEYNVYPIFCHHWFFHTVLRLALGCHESCQKHRLQ